MKTHLTRRIPLAVAIGLTLAMLALGFLAALGVRSLVAGTASAQPAVPNPGHNWDEIGLPEGTWPGLDADKLDGLDSTDLQTTSLPWTAITAKPAGFGDDIDDDILGGLSCANGEIAKWDGSTWQCATDDTGAGGDFWSLTGNSGTTPGTHFLGTTDNQALELRVDGERALRLEPPGGYYFSPNVIGGDGGNSATGGVHGATIAGGGNKWDPNRVTGHYGTLGGGRGNLASYDATVAGGYWNDASGAGATVGGGVSNTASGIRATVGGGGSNTATGDDAAVAGGNSNTASGDYATVPGGDTNTAQGDYSFAAGRRAKANHEGAFVWADSNVRDFPSTANNEFSARTTGGARFVSAIDGSGTPTAGVTLPPGGNAWSGISDRNVKANFASVDGQDILDRLASIPIET